MIDPAGDGRALLDRRGCLTPAGLEALAGAELGKGPAELAAHLAACVRCQDRLLSRERSARGPAPRPGLPPAERAARTVLVLVVLTVVALAGAYCLASRG